jgi:hypothetical protein
MNIKFGCNICLLSAILIFTNCDLFCAQTTVSQTSEMHAVEQCAGYQTIITTKLTSASDKIFCGIFITFLFTVLSGAIATVAFEKKAVFGKKTFGGSICGGVLGVILCLIMSKMEKSSVADFLNEVCIILKLIDESLRTLDKKDFAELSKDPFTIKQLFIFESALKTVDKNLETLKEFINGEEQENIYNLLLANVKKLQHCTHLEFVKIINVCVDRNIFFPTPMNGERYLDCADLDANPLTSELVSRIKLKIAEMWYAWVNQDPEFINFLSTSNPSGALGILGYELSILRNAKRIISGNLKFSNQEMAEKYKDLLIKIETCIAKFEEEVEKHRHVIANPTQKRDEQLQQELDKRLQQLSINF